MSDVSLGVIEDQIKDARVRDYFALLKPRVMSLVVFTGFAGMFAAPGFSDMHPFLALVAMFCLAVGAGAAGALNMWYEHDLDSIMKRTKDRPIPTGKIAPDDAFVFALFLSFFSVMVMAMATNWMAAGLLAAANLFYVLVYTMWLKRRTPQNIVIGGAAGAFPPMIGWAAVTGDVTLMPVILFAIIFIWTPPHFWALSLFANDDYKKAEIPMMSVTAGEKSTKRQMLFYTLLLFPVTLAPAFLGYAGMAYGLTAFFTGLFFIYTSIRVIMDEGLKSARLMFGYSVFYLFALFLGLIIDAA